jgi:hypothetical protein
MKPKRKVAAPVQGFLLSISSDLLHVQQEKRFYVKRTTK